MPMTLAEYVNLVDKPLIKGVVMAMLEEPFVIDRLPFENAGTLGVTITYVSSVPAAGFVDLNETPGEITTGLAQVQETLKIIREYADVDSALINNRESMQNPRTLRAKIAAKGIAYTVNDKLINGSVVTDPSEPDGLLRRLENDQRLVGPETSGNLRGQTRDAAGLDVDSSDANRLIWLDRIDEVIYMIDGHRPSFGIMNKQTLLKLRSILRALKLLDTTKDQFDRRIDVYADVPLLDIGVTAAGAIRGNESTQIIRDDNETSPFASTASTTSMYFVRTGSDYFMGIQKEPLQVEDIGRVSASPHLIRTYIEWILGWMVIQKRAVSRLAGLDIT